MRRNVINILERRTRQTRSPTRVMREPMPTKPNFVRYTTRHMDGHVMHSRNHHSLPFQPGTEAQLEHLLAGIEQRPRRQVAVCVCITHTPSQLVVLENICREGLMVL